MGRGSTDIGDLFVFDRQIVCISHTGTRLFDRQIECISDTGTRFFMQPTTCRKDTLGRGWLLLLLQDSTSIRTSTLEMIETHRTALVGPRSLCISLVNRLSPRLSNAYARGDDLRCNTVCGAQTPCSTGPLI